MLSLSLSLSFSVYDGDVISSHTINALTSSHTHTHTHTHSHTHTYTHSYIHTLTLTLSHTQYYGVRKKPSVPYSFLDGNHYEYILSGFFMVNAKHGRTLDTFCAILVYYQTIFDHKPPN